MNKIKNINSRWFIFVLIMILSFGFITTSMLSYLATKNYVIHSAVNQTLPLISDNIYSEIKKELLDPINVSSLMANDAFLIDWVESGENKLDSIKEYLSRIKSKYGYTSTFFVSDVSSNYYYSEGILKQVSEDDDHDVWYYDFKTTDQAVDLDVDNDEARQGILTVFINHRLESKTGKYLGATGVGLELIDIGEKFNTYQEQYKHEIYLVDENGFIQIHSNPTLIDTVNLMTREGISEYADDLLTPSDNIHIFEFIEGGELKAISIRYIPEFNWYLVIEKNQTESLLEARKSLWENIGIGLLVTIIITFLMIVIFKLYNHKMEQLATFDELTKLYNRRFFMQIISREIAIAQRYNHSLSLLMLDIDNFKEVNEKYGHMVGDEMLYMVSSMIKATVRNTDIVARWGGEEFVVLLMHTDIDEAIRTANRIRIAVAGKTLYTGHDEVFRTVSAGVATLDDDTNSEERLMKNADEALFRAKSKGKNRTAK
ncbi:MAG: GGDEF domain-containing protein [Anaerolineaceae bacterium]|nr:GGDEF domain-containing protein [Anaerolineaceae bacterium]